MLHELARMVGATSDDKTLTDPPVGEDASIGKPNVGLALGGGAARGWAHIGVIKALEEQGIEPQIIAGTSIGAVVGGCYAAGKLPELETWARSLTKRRVFSLMDLSLGGAGMINGARLRRLLESDIGPRSIEDLPIRFAAVATELRTGHEIWLTKGRLVQAMRASYALPGIFEPVRVGGRWLMDGALVNPVPVSTTRAMGARLVIGVNLQSDIYGRGAIVPMHGTDDADNDEAIRFTEGGQNGLFSAARGIFSKQVVSEVTGGPPGIPSVMMEAFNIVQDRISRARLAGDPPDVLLSPKLRGIGLFEFHRAAETIDLGYEIVQKNLDSIKEAALALV
ncbi:phospholipase [Agaricicola taiwanensis]|uniref:Phospholipase n=1 Tax=Agaricicola taiwanensis TaxID=591372 RepID=A0A8J2YJD4_9RHOB|nr:patatin-like phospholipase family protein [Agaricicola taiwanensis]GGE47869.1 phospholipase [Agaricicola taiwanensis]